MATKLKSPSRKPVPTKSKPKPVAAEKTSPALVKQAISSMGGILRLAPTWVPRSFLMPGGRLKLAPAGPLRPGHAPRRHRRALVRLDHAGRQRGRARRTRG